MEPLRFPRPVVPVNRFNTSHYLGSEVPAGRTDDCRDTEFDLGTVFTGKQSLPCGLGRLPILPWLLGGRGTAKSTR